jgi:polar amino acid transport system substrate-binding protein
MQDYISFPQLLHCLFKFWGGWPIRRDMRISVVSLSRLLALGLLMSLAAAAASAETLRLRADSWMPYNGDPAAAHPGFAVELAKAIFEPQGIKVDYQTMPWTEALTTARAGTIDGVIGAAPAETEGLTVPQESIGAPRVVLLVAKGNPWKFESIASLKTIRLGVIDGYSYWDSLDAYIKANHEPQVVTFKGDAPLVDALTQLKAGKIDAIPETMAVFIWTIKGMGFTSADFHIVHTHQNDPIYLAFSKTPNGKKYAKLFDEGVGKLRASGEFEKLLNLYGLTEWK